MATIQFINENGNASVKMRTGLRKQVMDVVYDAITAKRPDAVKGSVDSVAIPVGTDEKTGETVFVVVSAYVGTESMLEKKNAPRPRKPKEPTEDDIIPSIF